MKNKILSVAGYGSTGSSAVVNLLEEFDNCNVMGGEFRIIQDPDGIERFMLQYYQLMGLEPIWMLT